MAAAGRERMAGMPTWRKVRNATITRLCSDYNGSGPGSLAGHGISVELCSGTFTITDPVLTCAWHDTTVPGAVAPGNTGLRDPGTPYPQRRDDLSGRLLIFGGGARAVGISRCGIIAKRSQQC